MCVCVSMYYISCILISNQICISDEKFGLQKKKDAKKLNRSNMCSHCNGMMCVNFDAMYAGDKYIFALFLRDVEQMTERALESVVLLLCRDSKEILTRRL